MGNDSEITRLSVFQKRYTDVSAKAGDVARQLAFAGIAVVWVFSGSKTALAAPGQADVPLVPPGLLPPLLGFCLALGLDILQYLAATVIWGQFQWREEKKLTDPKNENPPVDAPSWYKMPPFALFWMKMFCVVAAFYLSARYIWGRPDFPQPF